MLIENYYVSIFIIGISILVTHEDRERCGFPSDSSEALRNSFKSRCNFYTSQCYKQILPIHLFTALSIHSLYEETHNQFLAGLFRDSFRSIGMTRTRQQLNPFLIQRSIDSAAGLTLLKGLTFQFTCCFRSRTSVATQTDEAPLWHPLSLASHFSVFVTDSNSIRLNGSSFKRSKIQLFYLSLSLSLSF